MLKLTLRSMSVLAATALTAITATATSASASTMPPPCPTHPLIYQSGGDLVIQYGCFAPITIPDSISTPPHA